MHYSPIYMFFKDKDIRSLYLSSNYEQMLGIPVEQLLGKSMDELFPSDLAKSMIADDQTILREGKVVEVEEEMNGRFYETIKFPIFFNGEPKYLAGFTLDVTERKQADQEKTRLEASLLHSQKMESIGTLAGGIAHEFNNVLGIIMGNNELLIDDSTDRILARQCSEEIRIASLRARDVVNQLLLFSRRDDTRNQVLEISSVVKESVRLIRSATPANVDIKLNISRNVGSVLGNRTQINQILINLCSNAIDAMFRPEGTIHIDLDNETLDESSSRSHPTLSPGLYAKLTVRDTGCGMDSKTLMRIFDPYFTTKEIGKGTGIGLAVVHGIVESHGGHLSVSSEPGRGTTFTILFPTCENPADQEPERQSALETGNECILLVDDEPLLLKLGIRRLELLGYTVRATTNPLEALEIFKAEADTFDLVITDMAMPGMTGEQLVPEILGIRPDTPIILCTGYSERMPAEKAYEIGVHTFIMKPIDISEFAKTVRKILDTNKAV